MKIELLEFVFVSVSSSEHVFASVFISVFVTVFVRIQKLGVGQGVGYCRLGWSRRR